MDQGTVWIGMAVLRLSQANAKRREGFTGAFAGIACLASDVVEAVRLASNELDENGYELLGFESFLPVDMLDRELTDYEEGLVSATSSYPVQFKDVHLHKGDA
jgi:hypothetical protein